MRAAAARRAVTLTRLGAASDAQVFALVVCVRLCVLALCQASHVLLPLLALHLFDHFGAFLRCEGTATAATATAGGGGYGGASGALSPPRCRGVMHRPRYFLNRRPLPLRGEAGRGGEGEGEGKDGSAPAAAAASASSSSSYWLAGAAEYLLASPATPAYLGSGSFLFLTQDTSEVLTPAPPLAMSRHNNHTATRDALSTVAAVAAASSSSSPPPASRVSSAPLPRLSVAESSLSSSSPPPVMFRSFSALRQWDAAHFDFIARHGYACEDVIVFFPLVPMLFRFVNSVLFLHLLPPGDSGGGAHYHQQEQQHYSMAVYNTSVTRALNWGVGRRLRPASVAGGAALFVALLNIVASGGGALLVRRLLLLTLLGPEAAARRPHRTRRPLLSAADKPGRPPRAVGRRETQGVSVTRARVAQGALGTLYDDFSTLLALPRRLLPPGSGEGKSDGGGTGEEQQVKGAAAAEDETGERASKGNQQKGKEEEEEEARSLRRYRAYVTAVYRLCGGCVLFFCLSPSAVFQVVAYTESLFTLVTAVGVYALACYAPLRFTHASHSSSSSSSKTVGNGDNCIPFLISQRESSVDAGSTRSERSHSVVSLQRVSLRTSVAAAAAAQSHARGEAQTRSRRLVEVPLALPCIDDADFLWNGKSDSSSDNDSSSSSNNSDAGTDEEDEKETDDDDEKDNIPQYYIVFRQSLLPSANELLAVACFVVGGVIRSNSIALAGFLLYPLVMLLVFPRRSYRRLRVTLGSQYAEELYKRACEGVVVAAAATAAAVTPSSSSSSACSLSCGVGVSPLKSKAATRETIVIRCPFLPPPLAVNALREKERQQMTKERKKKKNAQEKNNGTSESGTSGGGGAFLFVATALVPCGYTDRRNRAGAIEDLKELPNRSKGGDNLQGRKEKQEEEKTYKTVSFRFRVSYTAPPPDDDKRTTQRGGGSNNNNNSANAVMSIADRISFFFSRHYTLYFYLLTAVRACVLAAECAALAVPYLLMNRMGWEQYGHQYRPNMFSSPPSPSSLRAFASSAASAASSRHHSEGVSDDSNNNNDNNNNNNGVGVGVYSVLAGAGARGHSFHHYYRLTQAKFWDVGFLHSYRRLINYPNVLLAAPLAVVVLCAAWMFYVRPRIRRVWRACGYDESRAASWRHAKRRRPTGVNMYNSNNNNNNNTKSRNGGNTCRSERGKNNNKDKNKNDNKERNQRPLLRQRWWWQRSLLFLYRLAEALSDSCSICYTLAISLLSFTVIHVQVSTRFVGTSAGLYYLGAAALARAAAAAAAASSIPSSSLSFVSSTSLPDNTREAATATAAADEKETKKEAEEARLFSGNTTHSDTNHDENNRKSNSNNNTINDEQAAAAKGEKTKASMTSVGMLARFILVWCATYVIVGAIMFSNHQPWT